KPTGVIGTGWPASAARNQQNRNVSSQRFNRSCSAMFQRRSPVQCRHRASRLSSARRGWEGGEGAAAHLTSCIKTDCSELPFRGRESFLWRYVRTHRALDVPKRRSPALRTPGFTTSRARRGMLPRSRCTRLSQLPESLLRRSTAARAVVEEGRTDEV